MRVRCGVVQLERPDDGTLPLSRRTQSPLNVAGNLRGRLPFTSLCSVSEWSSILLKLFQFHEGRAEIEAFFNFTLFHVFAHMGILVCRA